MYKALILPLAKEDIQEASNWYNTQQKELGKRFIADLRETVHFIRQNPEVLKVRYNSVRTAVLSVFPFMIHFTIDKMNKTIIVVAILHTSRNPELWKKR